jgi:hypothetical protein
MLFARAKTVGPRRFNACMPTSAEIDAAIAKTAAQQHGLITRAQAIAAGATERMIQYRLATGRWEIAERGVYRISSSLKSWHQRLHAVCLANDAVTVSHRAAAALLDFPGFEPGILEFLVPTGIRFRRDGLIVHESCHLPPRDIKPIECIRVTAPHRTLFDIAAVSPKNPVEEALDYSVRRGFVTLKRMRWELKQVAVNGRAGVEVMTELLDLRELESVPQSVLETRFLRVVSSAGLPIPIPQWNVRSNGKLVAIVDFAYPYISLAIELDGDRYHSSRIQREHDSARQNELAALGWTVLRFRSSQLKKGGLEVVRTIRRLFPTETDK